MHNVYIMQQLAYQTIQIDFGTLQRKRLQYTFVQKRKHLSEINLRQGVEVSRLITKPRVEVTLPNMKQVPALFFVYMTADFCCIWGCIHWHSHLMELYCCNSPSATRARERSGAILIWAAQSGFVKRHRFQVVLRIRFPAGIRRRKDVTAINSETDSKVYSRFYILE